LRDKLGEQALNEERFTIGIDVGGTFTHGVVLNTRGELISSVKVLTTHTSEMGVAEGVIACLRELIKNKDIGRITSINHSTTQATNALLEGDLSPVRAYVLHGKNEGFIVKSQLGFNHLRLSPHSRIFVDFVFSAESGFSAQSITSNAGIPILIAQTLTLNEDLETPLRQKLLSELGDLVNPALVQCASSISRLLGLKSRVKTALINCAMLPTMLKTLSYMDSALSASGLNIPLMVMKSDGGVLPRELVFKKPLSCLLSGPAAAASSALHFAGINQGLFLDVGGTSTDICFIYQGKVGMRSASVGGHRLQMETLDLRTIALGGGSLIGRDAHGRLILGPRSAHLAGLGYLSFAPASLLEHGKLSVRRGAESLSPAEKSGNAKGASYYVWEMPGVGAGFTLTDFANLLGVIPQTDEAFAPKDKLVKPFDELLKELGLSRSVFERKIADEIIEKFLPVYKEYLRVFHPEKKLLRIVGGGGGVNSVLPFIAERLKVSCEVVPNYPVISAIGSALASSTVTVKIPSDTASAEDIERAKQLARAEFSDLKYLPEKVHYDFSFDKSGRTLTVVASAVRPYDIFAQRKSIEELKRVAEVAVGEIAVEKVFENESFVVLRSRSVRRAFASARYTVILDRVGRVRFLERNVEVVEVVGAEETRAMVANLYQTRRSYTDAGELSPRVYVLSPTVFYNLSSLNESSAISVLKEETSESASYLILFLKAEG